MKFDDLYNRVFVTEEEEALNQEVANPEDFDDVEPAPMPEVPEIDDMAPTTASSGVSSGNLNDYITQLEDFANKLNGTGADSLQSLVSKLDQVETPFEGIYSRTSSEIVDAAKTLRSVSEKLKNFIIYAARK
jgi:hypothetical protein